MRLAILMCACLAPAHVAIASEHAAQVTPLVPGLVVEELPLRLSNLNNLRFTPTGQLSALAYSGRVYLLEDSDHDGLEDRAQTYWDQPTLRVPVGMAWRGRNLYVSSHGKVSLLHDADGDGRAEREEVVSQGWPPTDVASGGIGDSQAKETVVAAEEVEQIVPQATSMMPKDLLKPFNPSDIDDLVAFLMAPAPAAAAHSEGSPARTASEIEAVLRALPKSPEPAERRALDVVLVDGVQDHGRGEHDYPAWREQWSKLLASAPRVTVHQARDWPSPQQWRDAEVVVLYFWNHDWSANRLAELDAYLARGGGLVVLHSALISDNDPEALATRLGLAAHPQRTKYRHGATELHFDDAPASPLVAGFKNLALRDETYWPMIGDRNKVDVLATAVEEGQEWPMLWTFKREKGRVFASVLGHYSSTYDDPLFRILVLRGIAWAANEPVDRFHGLIGQPAAQP